LLKQLGTVVYLEVNPETVLKRLKGDTTRPLLQGGDVTQRVKEFLAVRGPIYRETAGMVVDVNDRTVDEIVAELEERMGFE
ncbi:shikimate kinase, partial [Hungatella hathewayi]|uniref:shikimate kinase n=2 Tax=Lachnospiraceae TaxID=186803 RepID=UPI0005870F23